MHLNENLITALNHEAPWPACTPQISVVLKVWSGYLQAACLSADNV